MPIACNLSESTPSLTYPLSRAIDRSKANYHSSTHTKNVTIPHSLLALQNETCPGTSVLLPACVHEWHKTVTVCCYIIFLLVDVSWRWTLIMSLCGPCTASCTDPPVSVAIWSDWSCALSKNILTECPCMWGSRFKSSSLALFATSPNVVCWKLVCSAVATTVSIRAWIMATLLTEPWINLCFLFILFIHGCRSLSVAYIQSYVKVFLMHVC